MRAGVGITEFWDLTLKEMTLILRNYNETKEDEIRQQTIMNFNLANLVADFTTLRFNGKPIPSYDECFPQLTLNRMSQKEREELEYKQAMFLKEQMMFAAEAHNAKRANGGKE
jgi:hypothetical protein